MVEHRLAKARAAGSNPVSCFFYFRENDENCKEKGTECDDVLAPEEHSALFSVLDEWPHPGQSEGIAKGVRYRFYNFFLSTV